MNQSPKVSLGMTVYNGEAYLAEVLECLLAQTFADFELIISDNASPDRSGEICQRYAAQDARIRYQRQAENRGANWNFNHVAKLARGEYFKWAHQDDLCAPTFLERCVEVLQREPAVVWCHTDTAKIDAQGRIIQPAESTSAARGEVCRSPLAHWRFRDVLMHSTYWGIRCSGLMRTSVLHRTQLFRPYYGADKLVAAELALAGRYYQIPETLFRQRVHEGASSALATSRQQQEFACPQRPVKFPRWAILCDYVQMALAAPLPLWQKGMCLVWITRYLLQLRKWPHVLRSYLLRRGVGGGELKLLAQKSALPNQRLVRASSLSPMSEADNPRAIDRAGARVSAQR